MNPPQRFSNIGRRLSGQNSILTFGFRCVVFGCVCLLAWVAGTGKSFAQHLHVAQEGSTESSGVFAYLMVQGKHEHITAVQCSSNSVQVLFTKSISKDVVLPPVCVSNAVVVVSVDGTVTKYGLDGAQIFSSSVLKPGEVSRLAGRWDSSIVYLTGMSYDSQRKPRYRMLWIDVLGKNPVQKGDVATGEPKKAFRLGNDIVVCGDSNTERVAAPDDVRQR